MDDEKPTVGVSELAKRLRVNETAVRRVAKSPGFPMPPATLRPLRWTEGQVERILWAPQDHDEHQQRLRRMSSLKRR